MTLPIAKFVRGGPSATEADLRATAGVPNPGPDSEDRTVQAMAEILAMQQYMQSMLSVKKLTGITGATEGDTTTIAHGLTLSQIVGLNVLVTASNGNLIPPSFVRVFEFQYDVFIDPTVVRVILSIANSGSILNSAITALLTYEE